MTTSSTTAEPAQGNQARRCAVCEYDLRGLEVPRCPECGAAFNPDAPPPAAVPWLSRREIGWWRAYWATVRLVLLRPRSFGAKAHRAVEVPLGEALRFRVATIAVAVASACATGLLIAVAEGEALLSPATAVGFAIGTAVAAGYLAMATVGVNSGPFAGGSVASDLRFTRLRPFACAGLATSVFVPLVVAFDLMVSRSGVDLFLSPFAVLMVGLNWWMGEVAYQHFGGRFGAARVFLFALMLPVLWLVFAVGIAAIGGLVALFVSLLINL